MEQLARKYEGRVEFLFIYSQEAHGPRITNKAQRRRVAQEMRDSTSLQRRTLLDGFGADNVFSRFFFFQQNNPLVVLDIDGRTACTMVWTDPPAVDRLLSKLLANGGKWDPALQATEPQGPRGEAGAVDGSSSGNP